MDSGTDETDSSKTQKLQPLEVKMEEKMDQEPGKIEGFLLKRRKRPMKGWQKVGNMSIIYPITTKSWIILDPVKPGLTWIIQSSTIWILDDLDNPVNPSLS